MNAPRKSNLKLAAAALAVAVAAYGTPAAGLTPKEVMNLVAMTEGSAVTVESLKALGYIEGTPTLNFSGAYTESGFSSFTSGVVNGQLYSQSYTATLDGDIGEDIVISMSSTGQLGDQSFSTEGEVLWQYDTTANDYFRFEYSETGEINPFWVPFLIGVGSGIVANFIYDWITTPATPTPPPPQPGGQTININGNNNTVNKNSPTSSFQGSFIGGQFTGTVSPVPEPSTYALLLGGLGVVGWYGARRKRRPAAPAA